MKKATLVIVLGLLAAVLPDVVTPEAAWARFSSVPVAFASNGDWHETEVLEEPVTMVGMSWEPGSKPTAVWFRTRAKGAAWSPWTALPVSAEHGPDSDTREYRNQRPASEPVWTGPQDQVQFRLRGSRPTGASASLIDTTDRTKPLLRRFGDFFRPKAGTAVSAGLDQPAVIGRSAWDPTDSCHAAEADPPEYVQVTLAVVHHTDTANTYDAGDVAGQILGICTFHVNTRGWNDIGYNMLIDRFGRIWEGRAGGIGRGVSGAHAEGFNSYSTGIALLGDFEPSPAPTTSMQNALIDLLSWKLSVHNLDPAGTTTVVSKGSSKYAQGVVVTLETISGHRDVQSTSCPGSACYGLLGSFRSRSDQRWSPVPLSTYRNPSVGDFDGDGAPEGAVFRPADGTWRVSDPAGVGFSTSVWADFYTATGWTSQIVGDFNGDGRDDIANYHPSNGTWWVSRSTGTGFTTSLWADFHTAKGWTSQIVGDFNGDGRDDIANYHPSNGTWWVSRSTGTGFTTSLWADFHTAKGWTSQIVGDFNGDGRDDIANYHPSNGTWWVSRSTGTRFTTSLWADFITAKGWTSQIVGDFNGDGRDDIANYHPSSDRWYVSASTGTRFTTSLWATTPTSDHWSLTRVHDVDGDGVGEILQLDAYDGSWHRGTANGIKFEFLQVEDSPWRTTVGATGPAMTGPLLLTFFGQEFRWLRTDGLDGNEAITTESPSLPIP